MSNRNKKHLLPALMETVEGRRLFAVATAVPLTDLSPTAGAAPTKIDLSKVFTSTTIPGTVVRFPVSFGGVSANIDIGLFDKQTPKTVANFLKYVNNGLYNETFAHRLISAIKPENRFVLQMGGYAYPSIQHVKEYAPVINEFKTSPRNASGEVNTIGTVAMAKTGNDPNSATSEFFVNLNDNSSNLDNQNGGFTTFGRVLGTGMDVVNQIALLPISGGTGTGTLNLGLKDPFTSLPLADFNATDSSTITQQNLVYFNNVSVVKPITFQVTSNNNTLVNPVIDSNGVLSLTYGDKMTGTASITVTATDLDGASDTSTFNVNVGDGANLAVYYNGQRLNPSDTGAVNFGVLPVGQTATQQLLLQNTGTQTLTLGAVKATTGFSVVGNLPASLPAGGQANITVGIAPTLGGIQTGRLTIADNGPSGSLVLGLTADVRLRVALGSKTTKSIVFKETSGGTTATLNFTGSGTATVEFEGSKLSEKTSGGVTTVFGATGIGDIAIKGTNANSIFNLTGHGGDGLVTVANISSGSTTASTDIKLGQINAPAALVTTGITLGDTTAGGTSLGSLILGGLTNADLFIGSSSKSKDKVSMSLGKVTDTTIESGIAISTLTGSRWVDTDPSNVISAPSIDTLTIPNDFSSSLNLGTKGNLGTALIKGSITGGTWSVPGKTGSITAKSIATTFQAALTGAVGSLTTTGKLGGTFNTGSVGTITSGGALSDFTLTSTGSLAALKVNGAITGSKVEAGTSIGIVSAVSLTDSQIYAGIQSQALAGQILPTNKAQFVSPDKNGKIVSKIGSVTLPGTKSGFAFSNSAISAEQINTLAIGKVATAPTGGSSNGIAASFIGSISLTTDAISPTTGALQSIITTGVDRSSGLPQLATKAGTVRSFVITVITA